MSTNQIKRLRVMLRQNHTDPSWVRAKARGSGKTADQLLTEKLDWDGWESPSGRGNDRDVVLSPKSGSDADISTPQRVPAPARDLRKSSASYRGSAMTSDWTTLDEENTLLRRQIEVLMGQVAAGQHRLPQLNLRSIERPPSANAFLTEPPATERPRHTSRRRRVSPGKLDLDGIEPSSQIPPRPPSGAMTDRPRRNSARPRSEFHPKSHGHHRRSSVHSHGHKSPRMSSDSMHLASPHHDNSEKEALQQEVDALKVQHKATLEKMWGLEECLSAKDADLLVKEAELDHLRFLIGVKEGNEAQAERHLAFLQGRHAEDFVVNPEDNMAEMGKFTLRQIDSEIFKFEENLKEYEDHLRAGDEEAFEGQRLLTAIDDERERRKGRLTELTKGYEGVDGERLAVGCPDCGRMVMVADKEVDCQLIDTNEQEVVLETAVGVEVKPKKKMVRRFVGIDPPYDKIVRDPDRWLREKSTRRSMLTERKILDMATTVITEKIIADLIDDEANNQRGAMPYVVYEYFLAKFGVRSLADFYLLELIEGLKMFPKSNQRISWLANAMQLQWAGPKMEDAHMYFYLEVWRELSSLLADRKKASILKSKRQSTASSDTSRGKTAKGAESPVQVLTECLRVLNHKQEKDEPIVFKRLQVWKGIRRAMGSIFEHKWIPGEYESLEEVSTDVLGLGAQQMTLDEAMDYAMAEMDKMNDERCKLLKQAFIDADADGNGKMDFQEFSGLLELIDPGGNHTAIHLFRQIVGDQDDDSVDPDMFCTVMQRCHLDRPAQLNQVIRSRQGVGAEAFTEMFTRHTHETAGLLDIKAFKAIMDESQGSHYQITEAIAAFEKATINISSINEAVYTEIVRKVFMTTSVVAEVEDAGDRPKTDGAGIPKTFVRMGTYGGMDVRQGMARIGQSDL